MLSAIVDDFSRIPGVEVQSLLRRDLFPKDSHPHFLRIDSAEEKKAFLGLAARADLTMIIAPEFDDTLVERCQWVEEVNGRLLGPSVSSIRMTADKYALGQHLKANGIPTPDCWLSIPKVPEYPLVLKPRFGAGSLETFLIRGPEEWPAFRGEKAPRDLIVQPFVPGQSASVAVLVGPKLQLALPAASELLSRDGRFHYLGGRIPLSEDLTSRAQRLAHQAIESIPGLNGYVGVDLVLGSFADASDDWLIEINPRLTTSYIGLRALAESNLAQALIDVTLGRKVQALKWRPGQVQFSTDGKVSRL
jgi:predicted ATP-grasp superfamily ATP-dependent carboligase